MRGLFDGLCQPCSRRGSDVRDACEGGKASPEQVKELQKARKVIEEVQPYGSHDKTPLIRKWLAKRPRWHVHPTPTSSSWLNQVERFFALLTDKKIRRGVYRSVAALRADIASFIERHNADAKPFRWTKSADDILASVERFCRYNAPVQHDAMLRTSGSGH